MSAFLTVAFKIHLFVGGGVLLLATCSSKQVVFWDMTEFPSDMMEDDKVQNRDTDLCYDNLAALQQKENMWHVDENDNDPLRKVGQREKEFGNANQMLRKPKKSLFPRKVKFFCIHSTTCSNLPFSPSLWTYSSS